MKYFAFLSLLAFGLATCSGPQGPPGQTGLGEPDKGTDGNPRRRWNPRRWANRVNKVNKAKDRGADGGNNGTQMGPQGGQGQQWDRQG